MVCTKLRCVSACLSTRRPGRLCKPVMHVLAVVIFLVSSVAGLLVMPFGLPGLWIMVVGIIGAGWAEGFRTTGVGTIAAAVGLALMGELVEWGLGFHFARRYGGSRRAAWGALLGGLVGAAVGVPLPIVGSVVGAFAGSFAGAALFELVGSGRAETAVRVGWGALLGRVAGTAAKIALGLAIGVVGAFAVLPG